MTFVPALLDLPRGDCLPGATSTNACRGGTGSPERRATPLGQSESPIEKILKQNEDVTYSEGGGAERDEGQHVASTTLHYRSTRCIAGRGPAGSRGLESLSRVHKQPFKLVAALLYCREREKRVAREVDRARFTGRCDMRLPFFGPPVRGGRGVLTSDPSK